MRVGLVDTHVHLQLRDFDADREAVFHRAHDAGVDGFVVVGFDEETSRKAVRLAEEQADCWATVGLHPHDARNWSERLHATLRDLAEHPKVVAIGETGLDYYRNLSPREAQVHAFRRQIELARQLGKPLVIHNRDATGDALDIIEREADGVPTVLHCFSGDERDAERALRLGCFFGIGGPVTYPKSDTLRAVVRHLPSERFFVETDAPWLAPQTRRGGRNEPAFVRMTAEQIARVWGESVDVTAQRTTENACAFFGIRLETTARN
jgi:TatD DNase family protein